VCPNCFQKIKSQLRELFRQATKILAGRSYVLVLAPLGGQVLLESQGIFSGVTERQEFRQMIEGAFTPRTFQIQNWEVPFAVGKDSKMRFRKSVETLANFLMPGAKSAKHIFPFITKGLGTFLNSISAYQKLMKQILEPLREPSRYFLLVLDLFFFDLLDYFL